MVPRISCSRFCWRWFCLCCFSVQPLPLLILMQRFEDVSCKPWCLLRGASGRHEKIGLRQIMISFWLSANAFYKMLWLLTKRKWQIIFGNFINVSFLYCAIGCHYLLGMDKNQNYFSKSLLSSPKQSCVDLRYIPDLNDSFTHMYSKSPSEYLPAGYAVLSIA